MPGDDLMTVQLGPGLDLLALQIRRDEGLALASVDLRDATIAI